MEKLLKKHAEKIRFALVGGFNTALDFIILFGLVALGLDKIPANYISTTVTMVISFFIKCILFCIGAFFPGLQYSITQYAPVKDQINVF